MVKQKATAMCKICKTRGVLSDDHVPPLGCVGPGRKLLFTLQQYIRADTSRPIICQSGLKFKTICRKCNTLIGTEYDRELKRFAEQVSQLIRFDSDYSVFLPSRHKLEINQLLVAKAVAGHLMAAMPQDPEYEPDRGYPMLEAMRHFVLDPAAPMPDNLEFYCWFYPGANTIVMNGFGFGYANERQYYRECAQVLSLGLFTRVTTSARIITRKEVHTDGWKHQLDY